MTSRRKIKIFLLMMTTRKTTKVVTVVVRDPVIGKDAYEYEVELLMLGCLVKIQHHICSQIQISSLKDC